MNKYKIKEWYGRSGNNLVQILHMLVDSKNKNCCIIDNFQHPLFYVFNNIINKDGLKENKVYEWHWEEKFTQKMNLSDLKKLYNNHIKFKYKNEGPVYDIGIHIRAGDTFHLHRKHHHPLYVQPPLSFYENIISENKNKKISIVYEDNESPVINKLLEKYKNAPNIVFQSSNIVEDLLTLSRCKTFVMSMGTFPLIPYMISTTIEDIIVPTYMKRKEVWFGLHDDFVKDIELKGYLEIGDWKNSPEQRDLIVNYKINI